MEVSGQHHALAALFPEKKPRYPLNRRVCGPQSRSEFLPLLSRSLLPHQGTLAAVTLMRVCQSEDKTILYGDNTHFFGWQCLKLK